MDSDDCPTEIDCPNINKGGGRSSGLNAPHLFSALQIPCRLVVTEQALARSNHGPRRLPSPNLLGDRR
jgi:hypothetical protein